MEHTFQAILPELTVHLCRLRQIERWDHAAMPAPFWRFYWNPTPGAWVERSGERIHLEPDQWVLVSPGRPLLTGNTRPFEHFFVHFNLSGGRQLKSERMQQGSLSGNLTNPLTRLKKDAQSNQHSAQITGQLVLQCLCHALAQIPDEAWQAPIADERILSVIEMIHARSDSTPDSSTLAKAASMHPKSMARLFRKLVGQPPHRYALAWRLDGAIRSLLHGNDSVETVAATWGFHDRFHLTRLLAKHRGVTPGRLRRMEA